MDPRLNPGYLEAQMNGYRQELQQDMAKTMERVYDKGIRPAEIKATKCSLKCLENPDYKAQDVYRCQEACRASVQAASNHLQQTIERFQNRHERCIMICVDDLQNPYDGSPSNSPANQEAFLKCAKTCVSKATSSLPTLEQRVIDQMNKSL